MDVPNTNFLYNRSVMSISYIFPLVLFEEFVERCPTDI